MFSTRCLALSSGLLRSARCFTTSTARCTALLASTLPRHGNASSRTTFVAAGSSSSSLSAVQHFPPSQFNTSLAALSSWSSSSLLWRSSSSGSSLLDVCALPSRMFASDASRPGASITIPENAVEVQFVRSGGPGGQNVNKVNTKVVMRFKIEDAFWIEDDTKERLRAMYSNRINKEDELVINSTRHRTQNSNLKDCYEKLAVMIEQASVAPKERIPTETPKWAIEQRLKEKKIRSQVKKNRQQRPEW